MSLERELEVCRRAAERAAEVALRHRQRGISPETKPDGSPVTAADRECEALISRLLAEAFPDDGLLGEEGAEKGSQSGRRWIIDPIDGTRDFVRGNASWGILIGLESGSDPVAGVCYLPVLGEMYGACQGGGAYRNGERIRVSAIDEVSRAVLCVTGFDKITRHAFSGRLVEWMSRFWAVRSMGGCMDAMLVASGKAEAWIEPSVKPWDLAPLKIILEEAGGRFCNFDGGSSIYAGNCFACVPGLEAELRAFVSGLG